MRLNQSLISLPKVLHLQCGNTQADVKDSATLAGALGETIGQGTTHSNYWSHPVLITVSKIKNAMEQQVDPVLGLSEGESREFAWLPVEIEVCFRSEAGPSSSNSQAEINTKDDGESNRLVLSCRVIPYTVASTGAGANINNDVWIVFDGGKAEEVSSQRASMLPAFDYLKNSQEWTVHSFDLLAMILQVSPPPAEVLPAHLNPLGLSTSSSEKKHLVLQINKSQDFSPNGWHF